MLIEKQNLQKKKEKLLRLMIKEGHLFYEVQKLKEELRKDMGLTNE